MSGRVAAASPRRASQRLSRAYIGARRIDSAGFPQAAASSPLRAKSLPSGRAACRSRERAGSGPRCRPGRRLPPVRLRPRAAARPRRLRAERRRRRRDRGRGRAGRARRVRRRAAERRRRRSPASRRSPRSRSRRPAERGFSIAASRRRRQQRADPARRRHVRRLPPRAVRPGRPPLPLPVRQLHPVRASLHDRPRRPLRPAEHDDGRLRALRRLPPRVRGSGRPPLPRRAELLSRLRARGCSMPLGRGAVEPLLRDGAVVAVKGLGGYHLACDCGDEDAVARLRARKHREEKPFAVLTAEPELLVEISARGGRCSRSPARPIVLAPPPRGRPSRRRSRRARRGSAAAPVPPLHHLLCADFGAPLVLTSGNRSDEPIAIDDADARAPARRDRRRLPRPRPADPPPLRGLASSGPAFPLRRSRGSRRARSAPDRRAAPSLAVGAELKSTFCVARGRRRVPVATPRRPRLRARLPRVPRRHRALPRRCSASSPRRSPTTYIPSTSRRSGRWSRSGARRRAAPPRPRGRLPRRARRGRPGARARLRRHRLRHGRDALGRRAPALRPRGFERVAHLEPVPLPGGEAAIREPWRWRPSYLERAGRPVPFERWPLVRESLKVDPPLSSGMGRLFDAVAAVLGVRRGVTLRGPGRDRARAARRRREAEPYPWRFGDATALVAPCTTTSPPDGRARRSPRAFHETIAAGAAEACAEAGGPRTVVLSGGTFQNLRLLAIDPRSGSRSAASASSPTGSSRRTTAASATGRPQSQRGEAACV